MGRQQLAQTSAVARSRVAALGAEGSRGPWRWSGVAPEDPPSGPPAHAAWPVRALAPPRPDGPPRDWVERAEVGEPDEPDRPALHHRARRVLPAVLRDATIGPGSRGLRAMLAVAVLVAVVAGVAAWRARPDAEPVVAGTSIVVPSASASTATQTVVAVSGRVRRPGLVRLPAGARVADAVQAVGGALPGADLSTLNLARRVVDGELIAVGVPAPAASAGAGTPALSGAPESGAPLDLNSATADQFDTLPGVGPVLAERIVAYRTEHGAFRSVDQLREVEGIGDTRFERLKDLVRV